MDKMQDLGGVLRLWHERSLAPERQWDRVYRELLATLRDRGAAVMTAATPSRGSACADRSTSKEPT